MASVIASCSGSGHQITVHPEAAGRSPIPGRKAQGKRQLVVFFDGTWNQIGDRTNVRRLYEMTASRHNPNVLCFYDQGVGTGSIGSSGPKLGQLIGGGMGFGFQKNLREALTFVTEYYQPGDEISVFGFSRGAYCGQVFATLVAGAGIPSLPDNENMTTDERHSAAEQAVEKYYTEIERAEKQATKAGDKAIGRPTANLQNSAWRGRPAEEADEWRAAYWTQLCKLTEWNTQHSRHRPGIAVMGLWDPVEAMAWSVSSLWKTNLSNTRKAEFERHRGHRQHPVALLPNVQECYLALCLDEQRQPFMAELPDKRRGVPAKHEFVWFPGDHSDLGGGHGDGKDLAGLSMNWMLSKVGDRLLGDHGSQVRVHADPLAARHDLRISKALLRVRGEVFHENLPRVPVDDAKEKYEMTPVRSTGWQMKIHSSVLTRMAYQHDWLVPNGQNMAIDMTLGSPNKSENLVGPYIPRPFRTQKAGKDATKGWANHNWSAEEIRQHYPIVEE